MPRIRGEDLEKDSKVFVAGGSTLIGSAIIRRLHEQGYENIVGMPGHEPDLTDQGDVSSFFERVSPQYVFLAAGRSGGIKANQKYPAELMLDNLLVQCHVIDQSYRHNVRKLVYLASSCSYPRGAAQPMREEALMTGPLEPTNEAYAMAKIAGMSMCRAYGNQYGTRFVSVVPANAFGPGDDFSPQDSHVVPALIRKMHEAKTRRQGQVEIWGSGTARREFVFAPDLADGCIFVMQRYDDADPINVGGGTDLSIRELAEVIKDVVGYTGELNFNTEMPDGMPLKALDSSRIRTLGWQPNTPLRTAIALTYEWFLLNLA